ncbi:sugar transferase [Thermoleophilum album]|uniref:sugar transferase n=1 Tax=Thermoleophilum album TaxID=29539 RepID=UPI00237C52DA|nr:sugar transferase [Thermoleophilum album]
MAVFLVAVATATLIEGTTDPLWSLATAPLWALVAKLEGLYDGDHPRIWHRTSDEVARIFHWVTVSAAATLFLLRGLPEQTIRVESALALYFAALGGAFPARTAARALWRHLVRAERTLVIGDGPLASSVRRKLALEPHHNVDVVAQVRSVIGDGELWDRNGTNGSESHVAATEMFARSDTGAPAIAEARAVAGSEKRDGADSKHVVASGLTVDDLTHLVNKYEIERIVIAAQEIDEGTLARVVATCRQSGCKLSVVPPMPTMLGTAVELSHVAELPLIEYATWPIPRSTLVLKRLIDLTVGGALLLLVAPLMAVVAVAIKLDSPGPVLFRQRRAGKNGRPFTMLKFRTMCVNAEERLQELIDVDELDEPVFKIRNDPRVTRVGRWLRRLSIDELPQLINVVRGDMSLVGPRPEETWLVDRYKESERFRLLMRPGLTGPMQVHGRGDLTFAERLAVEREYVENYTLRKDLQILLRTFSAIVRGAGAY